MNLGIIEQQRAEATTNKTKTVSELKVGDFIFLNLGTLKNEGFLEAIADIALDGCYIPERLCKIEKIVHCTEKEMFENNFEFGEGGSSSDVFDSQDEIRSSGIQNVHIYFYSKVTLIIADSGKFAFVDAEGYDYPRYLLLWNNFREMYTKEIEQQRIDREERDRLREEEKERRRKEIKESHEKEIAEKWSFLDPKKSVKLNWIATCKNFFNFPVKVSKSKDWDGTINITLHCENYEQEEEVCKFLRETKYHFRYYSGERGTDSDGYGYEVCENSLEDVVPHFWDNVTTIILQERKLNK